jgi:hypothetical protein
MGCGLQIRRGMGRNRGSAKCPVLREITCLRRKDEYGTKNAFVSSECDRGSYVRFAKEVQMKLGARCKPFQSAHTCSAVLGRLSRLLARPKDTQTNEDGDVRFVLPFNLP